jgi:hypothetical protein
MLALQCYLIPVYKYGQAEWISDKSLDRYIHGENSIRDNSRSSAIKVDGIAASLDHARLLAECEKMQQCRAKINKRQLGTTCLLPKGVKIDRGKKCMCPGEGVSLL